MCGFAGGSSWHDHVQRLLVAMQDPVHCVHVSKRPAVHGNVAGAGRDAHADRPLAIELTMHSAADVPQAVNAARRDGVVGSAQRPVRAESDARGEHHCRWIAAARMKGYSEHAGSSPLADGRNADAELGHGTVLKKGGTASRREGLVGSRALGDDCLVPRKTPGMARARAGRSKNHKPARSVPETGTGFRRTCAQVSS